MKIFNERSADKVARILLNKKGKEVSGTYISERLGISRVAVHKFIKQLEEEGFKIIKKRGSGYTLVDYPNKPLKVLVDYRLKKMGAKHIRYAYFESLSSTHSQIGKIYLDNFEDIKPDKVYCVAAGEQTHGQGRYMRPWASPRGGIYVSLLITKEIPANYLGAITLAVGCAVAEVLEEAAGRRASIKWPNDVLFDDRKIAGVLLNGRVETGLVSHLFVGIGVNVNTKVQLRQRDLPVKPVSLKEITGREADLAGLMAHLLVRVIERVHEYPDNKPEIIKFTEERLWRKGQTARVATPSGDYIEGVILGLERRGRLLVSLNGEIKEVFSGEILTG